METTERTDPLSRVCAECNAQVDEYCVTMTVDGKRTNKRRAHHPCRLRPRVSEHQTKVTESYKRGAKRTAQLRGRAAQ